MAAVTPRIGNRLGSRLTGRSEKQEAFLRLALTHGASAAGDAMVTVALAGSIFFSTDVNGARGRVLLSMALTLAPFAVVAPFLGPAIDKSKGGRRLMVIISALGRCLAALYMAKEVNNLLLFLPAALAVLILTKAHAIAKSSLVPSTVDSPEDLVKAGGRLAVVATVCGLVAGGPAWAILKLFGADWSLRTAALVYFVAMILALRTRPAPPAVAPPPDHVDETVRSRGVSLAAITMASIRGVSGFLTFAVAFAFRRSKAPAWWFGVVLAGALIGGFVGNVGGPRLRKVLREERILLVGLVAMAMAGVLVALSGSRLAIAVVAFAVGLADGIGQLAFDAIVQRDGSEGSRARSFARYEATFQLTWVLAAVIPVAIPIPVWVAAFMIAMAAGASAINYAAGRYVVGKGGLERRTAALPASSGPGVGSSGPGWSGPGLSGVGSSGDRASSERPARAWDGGIKWGGSGAVPDDDAEPAPLRDLSPALAPPPPDPGSEEGPAPGPRRNPHRSGP